MTSKNTIKFPQALAKMMNGETMFCEELGCELKYDGTNILFRMPYDDGPKDESWRVEMDSINYFIHREFKVVDKYVLTFPEMLEKLNNDPSLEAYHRNCIPSVYFRLTDDDRFEPVNAPIKIISSVNFSMTEKLWYVKESNDNS